MIKIRVVQVNSAEAAEKPNKISETTINSEGWMTQINTCPSDNKLQHICSRPSDSIWTRCAQYDQVVLQQTALLWAPHITIKAYAKIDEIQDWKINPYP